MFLVPMTRSASELMRSFDRLFDESFDRFGSAPAGALARTPALDVAESDRAYTVTLEMPGVGKDDIQVSIDGRRVSVEARTAKTDEKKEAGRVIYRERSESSFSRSFTLPSEIDSAETSAKFDNGLLKLELPKRRAPGSAQITVK